jgi:hypothetical protein
MRHVALSQDFTAIASTSVLPRHLYVLMDNAPVAIHHVEAQAQRIVNKPDSAFPVNVEIYNILVPGNFVRQTTYPELRGVLSGTGDTLLIALSVLPTNGGLIVWKPITLDTIPFGHILTIADVVHDGVRRIEEYRKAGKPLDCLITSRINLFPIIKREERYWVPDTEVFTQYFVVQPLSTKSLAQADFVTINIKSPLVSPDAPWRTIRALLPAEINYEYTPYRGITLESIDKGVFAFWSSPFIGVSHPSRMHVGIGKFKYKPGIGIISGKYAQYFYNFNPFGYKINFNSITVNGKVMVR